MGWKNASWRWSCISMVARNKGAEKKRAASIGTFFDRARGGGVIVQLGGKGLEDGLLCALNTRKVVPNTIKQKKKKLSFQDQTEEGGSVVNFVLLSRRDTQTQLALRSKV